MKKTIEFTDEQLYLLRTIVRAEIKQANNLTASYMDKNDMELAEQSYIYKVNVEEILDLLNK